jgi:3-hydroxybutyryl-CoA dehydratase
MIDLDLGKARDKMKEYTWSDIHIGLSHSFEATFTAEMVRSFAELSGDTNPLHVDESYAVANGFPGTVMFGLMTSSLYSRLVGLYLPGKFALLQGIDIDFNSSAFVDDVLTVQGQVSFLVEAYKRFEMKASIRKTNRKLVSKATIRVGFHGG